MGSSVFCKYPSTYDFGGKRVLNIGCGFAQFTAKNVVNLDAEACSNADVIWDLSKTPLPFESDSFDAIIANHILEHVPNWWKCFEECARILKVGGEMEIWVPGDGADSQLGFRDHINVINHCSFWGTYSLFRNPNNAWAMANAGGPANQMLCYRQDFNMEKDWWIRHAPKWAQRWMSKYLRNTVYEVGYFFKKKALPPAVPVFNPAIVDAL